MEPRTNSFLHVLPRALVLLAIAVVVAATTHPRTAAGLVAISPPAHHDGGSPGLQLAYELEQPANVGSGLSVPGDVNVVGEGGFEAPTAAPAAPAEQGHHGVVVGPPFGGSERTGGIEAEREREMEARSGRPMGFDGPSHGQIDLETPSARQMDLEAPSARQLDLETPSARQDELER